MSAEKEESSETSAESSGAQIISLGVYSEIPDPDIPLDVVGRRVYDDRCRSLLETRHLTLKTREYVELLAIAKQTMAAHIQKGRQPTKGHLEAVRAAMLKLEKIDSDKTFNGHEKAENVYGRFGFAKRAREARHSG